MSTNRYCEEVSETAALYALGKLPEAEARIFERRNTHLEMDVDDEADLRALMQHDLTGTNTGAWLQDSGLWNKLRFGFAARASVATRI